MAFSIFTAPVQDVLPSAIKKRVSEHRCTGEGENMSEETRDLYLQEKRVNRGDCAYVQHCKGALQAALCRKSVG